MWTCNLYLYHFCSGLLSLTVQFSVHEGDVVNGDFFKTAFLTIV